MLPRTAVEVVIKNQRWTISDENRPGPGFCQGSLKGPDNATDGPGAWVALTMMECGDLCSRTGKTETHRKAEAVIPRIGKI